MTNYSDIEKHCKHQSDVLRMFIDDFFLNFIAKKENLEERFVKKLSRYKDVVRDFPETWFNHAIAQYMAHLAFKKNGLAAKYAEHKTIQKRSVDERKFFENHLQRPWRFSFCVIKHEPADNFFEMQDLFSNETFLLYSPGIKDMCEQYGDIKSFFILMNNNGSCYQSFSIINYFMSFDASDFFFFARQLNPEMIFHNQAQVLIEENPIPFMLLYLFAEFPVNISRGQRLVYCFSEYQLDDFEPDEYRNDFVIEKKQQLFRLGLKRWQGFPHLAHCYFHRKKRRFIITAMTVKGYDNLIEALNKTGYDFPFNPDVSASPVMLQVVKRFFNIKHDLDPYGKFFEKNQEPANTEEMGKLNVFMGMLMKSLDSRETFDISEMAEEAGVDLETAEQIAESVAKKLRSE
ncbi:MAG: hypothetical protein HQK83_13330 [Fibrobacteria bacterium]|nr:hypothetical protein [Fibrobacteria bacterium]